MEQKHCGTQKLFGTHFNNVATHRACTEVKYNDKAALGGGKTDICTIARKEQLICLYFYGLVATLFFSRCQYRVMA